MIRGWPRAYSLNVIVSAIGSRVFFRVRAFFRVRGLGLGLGFGVGFGYPLTLKKPLKTLYPFKNRAILLLIRWHLAKMRALLLMYGVKWNKYTTIISTIKVLVQNVLTWNLYIISKFSKICVSSIFYRTLSIAFWSFNLHPITEPIEIMISGFYATIRKSKTDTLFPQFTFSWNYRHDLRS